MLKAPFNFYIMNSEKQYIQAFNNGYVLAKHEPDFLNLLIRNLTPTNNYLQGFFSGRKQVDMENNKNHLSELQLLRNRSNDIELSIDKDN